MLMSDILDPTAVKVLTSCTSKKRLFQDLGSLADSVSGLSAVDVVDALTERENLGPTAVGKGIALPHARIEGIEDVCGIFVRLEKPLDFDAADKQPVDLVFALLAPVNAGVQHLKALALVSRTMRNADTCAKLRANSDVAALHTLLTQTEANQAA